MSSLHVSSGTTTSWQQAVGRLVEIHIVLQTLLLLLQTRLLPKRSTSSKYFYPCILDIRNHCVPSQIRAPLCQRREDEAMEVTNIWVSITMLLKVAEVSSAAASALTTAEPSTSASLCFSPRSKGKSWNSRTCDLWHFWKCWQTENIHSCQAVCNRPVLFKRECTLNLSHTLRHRPRTGLMPEIVEHVLRRSQIRSVYSPPSYRGFYSSFCRQFCFGKEKE